MKVIIYLRIHFDSKLAFHSHVDYIPEKSRKLVYTLSKTAKINWVLGHKAFENHI